MGEPTAGEVLRAAGAIKTGHFLYSSGLHGDTYVEKFDLLRNPRATEQICGGFVRAFADAGVEVVAGPTTGGILLAFETARQLGVAAAYAEREGETGRAFRRGTTFASRRARPRRGRHSDDGRQCARDARRARCA